MINKEKLLLNTTLDEFVEALKLGLGLALNEEEHKSNEEHHYVYGLKGLADLLGCSHSTSARIHQSGDISCATCKRGRILVFDADLVIDILKIKRRR